MAFRSISLPSRLHPINSTGFEANLEKLKSCFSKTVPITAETIQSGLFGLAELYSSVQELTEPQSSRQSLVQDGKLIEDSLEGSVELLDSCSSIRELAQMIRENVRSLQSALRRKGLDSTVHDDVAFYMCFRKKMNKCVSKGLKTLKNLENKNGSNLSIGEDSESSIIRVLREVTGLTIAIFRCILLFMSWPPTAAKSGGWNLVSRLMVSKPAVSCGAGVVGEVGCVDFALKALQGRERNVHDVQMVQRSLQNLDACVEGIEGGLEILFRQLVQSRVTLLNILTDH